MVKFILCWLLVLGSASASYAQRALKESHEIGPFEGVIRDSTVSQADLYKRCKQWVLTTFRSYDNNIAVSDAAADMLITTPVLNLEKRTFRGVAPTSVNRCSFKLTILFKEGRLKYRFDNFTHQYTVQAYTSTMASPPPIVYDGSFANSPLYKNKEDKMQPELTALINGYIAELQKAARGSSAKTDW